MTQLSESFLKRLILSYLGLYKNVTKAPFPPRWNISVHEEQCVNGVVGKGQATLTHQSSYLYSPQTRGSSSAREVRLCGQEDDQVSFFASLNFSFSSVNDGKSVLMILPNNTSPPPPPLLPQVSFEGEME